MLGSRVNYWLWHNHDAYDDAYERCPTGTKLNFGETRLRPHCGGWCCHRPKHAKFPPSLSVALSQCCALDGRLTGRAEQVAGKEVGRELRQSELFCDFLQKLNIWDKELLKKIFFRLLKSRELLLGKDFTMADLNSDGKPPETRDELIMRLAMGRSSSKYSTTQEVWTGLSEQIW